MNFRLRPMNENDIELTFKWRNDPLVRNNAQSVQEISLNEHAAWVKFNNSVKLIFEVDDIPAGFISVTRDPENNSGEWAFHMAPDMRGQGLSELMLKAALYYLAKKEGYDTIYSTVRVYNVLSKHLHEKLEFSKCGEDEEYIKYIFYL